MTDQALSKAELDAIDRQAHEVASKIWADALEIVQKQGTNSGSQRNVTRDEFTRLSAFSQASFRLLYGLALKHTAKREKLEQRMAEIEEGGIRYLGAWQRAMTYGKGDAVTHAGSLFIALRETTATPGKSTDWQLAAKAGRDGKDAR
jgi:hypothetical protein